jgi:hypothetical protein
MEQKPREQDKEIADIISALEGVIALKMLREEEALRVKQLCPVRERNNFADIVSTGLEEVLSREKQWVLLKDTTFRPPPGKTVFMVEDGDEQSPAKDHFLSLGKRSYRIIGEELFTGEKPPEEPHMLLGDGFVLFTERRKGTKHLPAYFLLPPIGFPELEERKELLGIENIVSVSPSAGSDMLLRNMFGFDMRSEYATILIGMDMRPVLSRW